MTRRVALLLAAALGGCAVAPVAPPSGMPPADPAAMPAWTASGRLALASRDQGGSGSFTWEQDRDLTTLSIRGPLGAGALQVIADGPALSIVDADGHSVDTGQARTALRDRLGADLPWQHLRYWMLGVPSPAEPGSVATSPQPPLRVIEQSGWRVGYEAFEPAGGAWLPVRFTATQGAVRLKVVVDDWAVAGARGRQR